MGGIGGTKTDMMSAAPPQMIQWLIDSTPFKRLGTIADISDAVALIASESARWISGQNITVAGAAK
jgi:3-oxoacyl-[acyl-carrier protein] reductase